LWLALGGDHTFEGSRRPVASCYCICPLGIYGRNIIVPFTGYDTKTWMI
jgi:hypothetical protein